MTTKKHADSELSAKYDALVHVAHEALAALKVSRPITNDLDEYEKHFHRHKLAIELFEIELGEQTRGKK